MKTMITIIDCENFDHKIKLLVEDNMSDVAYYAIEKHKGLSNAQIRKLKAFESECQGPYMVKGEYYSENGSKCIFDGTSDETGRFTAGHRIYEGEKYMHILFLTNWQGQRDRAYRIDMAKYTGVEDALDFANEWDNEIWHGEKIS